ncbi:hypothetical protein SprV_0802598200 [Sparganum proliferum]
MAGQLMVMHGSAFPAFSFSPESSLSGLKPDIARFAYKVVILQKQTTLSSSRSLRRSLILPPQLPPAGIASLLVPKLVAAPLHVPSFLSSPKVSVTNLPGSRSSGDTFYVCDIQSGRPFLIDAGAHLCVTPPTTADFWCPNSGISLQAVKISSTATLGTCLTLIGHRPPLSCRMWRGQKDNDSQIKVGEDGLGLVDIYC